MCAKREEDLASCTVNVPECKNLCSLREVEVEQWERQVVEDGDVQTKEKE
jgi:hypothetical protein